MRHGDGLGAGHGQFLVHAVDGTPLDAAEAATAGAAGRLMMLS